MSKGKTCKQCGNTFIIDDETVEFLKRISPAFDNKIFEIPTNEFCKECRHARRLCWRNEINLYKRNCSLCNKEMVSMYSPNKPYKVYCLSCWWSDKWSGLEFGLEYDPQKSFMDQLEHLLYRVPHAGMTVTNSENCDYCTNTVDSKNCYMLLSARAENSMYGRKLVDCMEVIDSLFTSNSENCYEIVFSDNCYSSKFVFYCKNCSDSSFLFDCSDCDDCFMSSNLRHGKYVFRNEQLTKEQYNNACKKVYDGSHSKLELLKSEYQKMIRNSVHKENRNISCENCTGNYLTNCKSCKECFETAGAESSYRVYDSIGAPSSNQIDCDLVPGSEFNYESTSSYPLFNSAFCILDYGCHDSYYSINCQNGCSKLFGCVGLKHHEYCILNKKYSKDAYEKRVAEIVESMIRRKEWGQFMDPRIAFYGYNETISNDFWPMKKSGALKAGYKWEDMDASLKFDGDYYVPKDNIEAYKNSNEREKILTGVLRCDVSGKPYKIMPQELAFYLKNNIPIPSVGFFERHKARLKMRNPRKLFDRKCDMCKKEMKTTYAPDRPERVYCEECYQKAVI